MADKVVRKPAVRKTAPRSSNRKAPTREVGGNGAGRHSKAVFIAIGAFVVFFGMSLAIGFSDSGQINVSSTFNTIRTSGTEEQQEQLRNIPVQQGRSALPDGGLVPSGDVNPEPVVPEPETASSTATTTDETASSTDSVTEESPTETAEEVGDESSPSDTGEVE